MICLVGICTLNDELGLRFGKKTSSPSPLLLPVAMPFPFVCSLDRFVVLQFPFSFFFQKNFPIFVFLFFLFFSFSRRYDASSKFGSRGSRVHIISSPFNYIRNNGKMVTWQGTFSTQKHRYSPVNARIDNVTV